MSTATATPVAPPRRDERAGGTLTATGTLLRFALRRDRVRTAVWAASVALLFLYAATALDAVYPTAADRQVRAQLVSSPAAIMMSGPGYGLDDYTLGAMVANEFTLWAMVAVAIMNVLLVVRHTRAEEESGRSELVRAGVVGRHAPATAALLLAVVADLLIAVLSGSVLVAAGLAAVDSFALGLAVGVTGLVFAAVAVVTSQLTAHGRTASGLALAVLGAAYLLRAVGDVEQLHGSWVSWLSPIAWGQQIRAFVDLRWWPLALSLALVVLLLLAGSALAARRDVGAGLLPPRRGRADAAASLRGPFALAWRQQRGSVLAWGVGIGLMAYASGTFADSVSEMVDELAATNPAILELFGEADMVAGFVGVMTVFLALAVGGFAVASALRVRAEETSGRAEPVLATATSRAGWLGGQLAVTALGALVLLLVAGLALGLGALSVGVSDPGLGEYVLAALAYSPAVLALVGVVWLFLGWRPGLVGLAWVVLAWAFVVGMFGGLLDLPDAVMGLSPYWHVPQLPADQVDGTGLAALSAVAVALLALGFAGFRRRDVTSS
ncbi:ABC transporter permease [Cellulosimicrobium cellulans]|uniref:ABC transporter permease n=1 Tax=Cellulosimicrobium cellulans TaxID=1710 RepID=UPI0009F4A8CB|nr:polyketide antibiotic transporter [Cellulosimicrobium cellulans]